MISYMVLGHFVNKPFYKPSKSNLSTLSSRIFAHLTTLWLTRSTGYKSTHPPLFWPLGLKSWLPPLSYFRIHFVGFADLLMSTSKRHFAANFILNIFVIQISRVWKAKLWALYIGSQMVIMVMIVMRSIVFRHQILS